MFHVVVQTILHNLKSKLRPPKSPMSRTETDKKHEHKDRTGFIVIFAVVGGLLLIAIFSNIPTN